jgi:hypothetical protein
MAPIKSLSSSEGNLPWLLLRTSIKSKRHDVSWGMVIGYLFTCLTVD